jgi:hypothetical protein
MDDYHQVSIGHALNRQTTHGHAKQSLADDIWSFANLVETRGLTQVVSAPVFKFLLFLIARLCYRLR